MKTMTLITVVVLTGCSAFTSPEDPETGIRQDLPETWENTPNPLDTLHEDLPPHPAEGNFGKHWKGTRSY